MFSTRQLAFGIATFIGGSSLFTVFITQITFHDSWAAVMLAFLLSLGVIFLYTRLIMRFPGKGLLEMHLKVYGKTVGRIINFSYLLFCIAFAAISLRNLGDFFTGYIMTEMPLWFMMAAVAATAAMAARGGISGILRISFLFFCLMTAALLTNSLLLIPNMRLYHFLPALRLPVEAYAKSAFVLSAAPLCESVVFLILLPYADRRGKPQKSFLAGLLLGTLYFMITICRDIATLGTSLSFLTEPAYEAVRLINLLDIFSRLEIVFAFSILIMRVFKISILFCAAVRACEDTLCRPLEHPGRWLSAATIGSTLLGLYAFKTGMTLPEWFRSVGAWLFAAFEMALPLLLLVVAKMRKKG